MFFRKKISFDAWSDEDLLQEFRKNLNSELIGVLFNRYSHLVLGICMKYYKNTEDAKDGVMQIFEKLPALRAHAAAMLGDPGVLLFDEPVNGLDPEGIRWIRNLIRSLAAEGRTVFVSSHLMSEMALTADHLLVIGQGKILADTDMNANWLRGNPESFAAASVYSAFKRIADVTDIADIVAFLASHDARWITGQLIDGGGGSGI